jgi:hypothetical protein
LSKQPITVLNHSSALRDGFFDLSHSKRDRYFIDIVMSDAKDSLAEHDIVFIGRNGFLIYATSNYKFYSRPCLNDPTTAKLRSDLKIESPCIYGGYFDTFALALETTLDWMRMDPDQIPMCENPPVINYIKTA